MSRDVITLEQWEREIEEQHKKLLQNRGVEVPALKHGEGNLTSMGIINNHITQDMIFTVSNVMGDPNPLWRDEAYAKKTKWGGIIAPPMAELLISETAASPDIPDVPGIRVMNCGSKRVYYGKIRPGDTFTATDNLKDIVDKSKPGRQEKQFLYLSERRIYNQRGELVVSVIASLFAFFSPPGAPAIIPPKQDYTKLKPFRYSKELLDEIYTNYEDCLSGKYRRGAQTRYYEDVEIGEELHPIYCGPYDTTDAASLAAIVGYGMSGAMKYKEIRDSGRGIMDPDTGVMRCGFDWHLDALIAREIGVPYPPIFATHIETSIVHLCCDWMGDDGEIFSTETRVKNMMFLGEAWKVIGKVVDKYEDDTGAYAVIEAQAVNLVPRPGKDGPVFITSSTNTSIIRLPKKA